MKRKLTFSSDIVIIDSLASLLLKILFFRELDLGLRACHST